MPSAVFENLFHLKLNLGFTTINLPTPILLMVALYIIFHIIMTHTRLGRHVYAIGGNPEAARLSGVPVNRVLLIVYSISGLMAGIAGVIMCTEYKSGKGIWGAALELDVIAAVVVGGTSLMGGRGRILGTLIGCAIIVVIKNGMNLMSLRDNTQNIVLGLVILAAIIIDQFKKGEYSWGTSRK
jgi:ribose transport system permease protein